MALSTPVSERPNAPIEVAEEQGPERRAAAAFLLALLRSPSVLLSVIVLLALIAVSIAAPAIAPYNPVQADIRDHLQGPSAAHWFGTDELGRDLFSRVLWGGRVSLLTAGVAVVVATLVGVTLGLVSGYFGGVADAVIMRAVDVLLAMPAILIAMGLIAVLGRSTLNAAMAVALVNIPTFARITRASTLGLRELDFVVATRASGARDSYVLFRTILPNVLSPILVQMAVTAATAILLESGLSFLGLGTQPPTPSWGQMLSTGKSYLDQAPWYGITPGIFLMVTVLVLDVISRFLQKVLGGGTSGELVL